MADATNPGCAASEFEVFTQRIPISAPVVSGNAQIVTGAANDVAFWILVP